jgi:hypothetical protein
MKIDGGALSAYAFTKPRATAEAGLYSAANEAAPPRSISSSGPAAAMPSGLANALWINKAKLEEAQRMSESPVVEFMELAKMTAVERLRNELLEDMELTEESLAALPPEERSAIEEEIRRTIKQRLGVDDPSHAGTAEGQTAAGVPEAEA